MTSISDVLGSDRVILQSEFWAGPTWRQVRRTNLAARLLADRHYSRQTVGAREWLPPGKVLALLTSDRTAVWGVCQNLDPTGTARWRVTMFRNEGTTRSSELIGVATALTYAYWDRHYGMPDVPLTTEVDPQAVRRKRDPGRCFRRAGWSMQGKRRGLVLFVAPPPEVYL